jgi:hypothetical protein
MTFATEYVIRMRESLMWFHDETSRFIKDHGPEPKQGSLAEIERTTFSRPESIVTCWALWSFLAELGGEHVTLFVKSTTEPVESIACYTCVRSMLESCALAAWFADPSIDARTRVGRALAHRYAGVVEQLKFGRVAGRPATEIAAGEAQLDMIEQDAVALGFKMRKNKNAERTGVADGTRPATEMIKLMLDEEKNYKLLSGVAHGHFWAIHGLSYQPSDETPDLMVGTVVVKGCEKVMKFEPTALMGSCVFKSLARSLWNRSHYFGWDALRLEELFENVADKLQLNPARRFWRS